MSALQSRADAGSNLSISAAAAMWLFGATVLVSAALSFSVQPLFARLILPLLGGTPAIWNTCLVFFQTTLLGGYFYVHVLTTRLTQRRQVLVHALLLAASLAFLPLARPEAATSATVSPVTWLLLTLSASLAIPFLALAATAPLLQRWFAIRTGEDPYFLYAASNAGSLIGLLSYPFVLEPTLTLDTQRRLWSMAMAAAVVFVLLCGLTSLPDRREKMSVGDGTKPEPDTTVSAVTFQERLRWLGLAFVPSSLLLGVTLHISTDVAAVPLLWVVPLTLYLLTFISAFASKSIHSRMWMNRFAPPAILAAIVALVFNPPWLIGLGIHLGAFATVALVCHRELAERRPAPAHLTMFYLCLSLGGALGGLFNAIVAPVAFTQVIEYPMMLAVAAMLRPTAAWRGGALESSIPVIAIPLLVFGVVASTWLLGLLPGISGASVVSTYWLCAAVALAFVNRRTAFAMAIAAVVLSHSLLPRQEGTHTLFTARSFFGVHRVTQSSSPAATRLFHGTTLHGWQALEARGRCEPTSYYHSSGPIGQVFGALGDKVRDVAIIGLGAGSLACYGRHDTAFTFFEIDPVIERIARDPSLFTYLTNGRGLQRVVIGDGRVALEDTPAHSLDVLVVDAFSSDAIPTHLLTREFVELARTRLRPDGLIAFHISNRNLDLGPVLAATARSAGLDAWGQYHSPVLADASASRWMLIGPPGGSLERVVSDDRWRVATPASRPWTDDFSNLLDVLAWSGTAAAGSN